MRCLCHSPQALLERPAWQLSRAQLSVTDISLGTSAFRKAFGVSPIGGMFAYVITSNYYLRMIAIDALGRLGVKVEGFGCPREYMASQVKA